MELLQKFFLSICLVFFGSCATDTTNLSDTERSALSKKIFDEGSHLYQGSPKSMTRIAHAIEVDPGNCEAQRELSVAYLKRGMPLEWEPQMNKAVACDPALWQPYRGYNYLWFYRDYKKAIADFNASDTLTPNFIDAPQGHSVDYWRGIAYLGLKDYKNSIAYFDRYIDQETLDYGEDWAEPTAFLFRGIAYLEDEDTVNALLNFDKFDFYSKGRTSDANYYKALIFKQRGDCEKALTLIETAITNFDEGYFNSRAYVETLRQIYRKDLTSLKTEIDTCLNEPS